MRETWSHNRRNNMSIISILLVLGTTLGFGVLFYFAWFHESEEVKALRSRAKAAAQRRQNEREYLEWIKPENDTPERAARRVRDITGGR